MSTSRVFSGSSIQAMLRLSVLVACVIGFSPKKRCFGASLPTTDDEAPTIEVPLEVVVGGEIEGVASDPAGVSISLYFKDNIIETDTSCIGTENAFSLSIEGVGEGERVTVVAVDGFGNETSVEVDVVSKVETAMVTTATMNLEATP